MNKTELIAAIAEKTEMTKKDTAKALEGFIEAVQDALANGEAVKLTGFGSFEVRDRAARTGVNPQTGETLQIPAKKAPAFKVSKALKEAVNA